MPILSQSRQRKKLLIIGSMPIVLDMNADSSSDSEGEEIEEATQHLTCLNSHDSYNVSPKFLYDLHVDILARVPCSEYWKLQFLNKRFSQLLKSSEIFRVRRERGLVKPYIFLLSSGATRWTMFDQDFENYQKLPKLSSDRFYLDRDKEIINAGTQLIVVGKEVKGITVWRYELEMQAWVEDPSMITPRVMFGSASHGTNAFFAGGIAQIGSNNCEVVNIAEKYDAETRTWTSIHAMHKRRKLCSGCFFRGKFYVLGGVDENDEYLTCGESYNEVTDSWELIPDMLKDMSHSFFRASPHVAVVNDNLYLLETSLDELRVYDANTNAWKKLGVVPVGAHFTRGWGIAFKAVGDRLMVIGASSARLQSQTMAVYKCRPSPNMEEIVWEECKSSYRDVRLNHFIINSCVMFA